MRTSTVWILAVAGVLLSQASCDSSLSPDEVLVIGTLLDELASGLPILPIEVPDTVAADIAFVVTVWTTGGGCERIGPTEVRTDGITATVVPYDFTVAPPGSAVDCDLNFKTFEHRAAIVFEASGSATVTVRARDGPSGAVQDHVHHIWVR